MGFKHIRRPEEPRLPPPRMPKSWDPADGCEVYLLDAETERRLGPARTTEYIYGIAVDRGWRLTMYDWYLMVRMDRVPHAFAVRYYWPKT